MSHSGIHGLFPSGISNVGFTNVENPSVFFMPIDYYNDGKRYREDNIIPQTPHLQTIQQGEKIHGAQLIHEDPPIVLPESPMKRARFNTFKEPRVIAPSILAASGSLVGGVPSGGGGSGKYQGSNNCLPFVPFRRQLSIGALDSYIGGHDGMDLDVQDQTKSRSMSF